MENRGKKQLKNFAKVLLERPASKAFGLLSDAFNHEDSKSEQHSAALVSLMRAVIWADGDVSEDEISRFRELLSSNYPTVKIDSFVRQLTRKAPDDDEINNALKVLSDSDAGEKLTVFRGLMCLAFAGNEDKKSCREKVYELASRLDIDRSVLSEFEEEAKNHNDRRQRIIKSGMGIIVALIVILIFIMAATLLKSVLFGLLLAYIFMPLERFYENRLRNSPVFRAIFTFFGACLLPFRKVADVLISRRKKRELSAEELAKLEESKLISRSVTATIATFVIGLILVITLLFTASVRYATGLSNSLKEWVQTESAAVEQEQEQKQAQKAGAASEKQVPGVAGTEDSQVGPDTTGVDSDSNKKLPSGWKKALCKLESFREDFEKFPIVNWAVTQIREVIGNSEVRNEVMLAVLKKTGGIFSFTAGLVGTIFSFVLNVLLTIFFFSLILKKMAVYRHESDKRREKSGYLLKSLFASKWLPQAGQGAMEEAQDILSGVAYKLRSWIRGYLTIILVEGSIYSVCFLILGVPYAILLGYLAGCAILLPYIGPVMSALITLAVCLAVHPHVSMLILIAIIVLYCLITGIVDQLFLYPSIVGESLGLTTLETIIVVLLGGLFAGITGMIFAVPTTSVLKYLIAKIYKCWQ